MLRRVIHMRGNDDKSPNVSAPLTYPRICRDFYREKNDGTDRLRIFGMTASPFDVEDIEDNLAEQLKYNMDHEFITLTSY